MKNKYKQILTFIFKILILIVSYLYLKYKLTSDNQYLMLIDFYKNIDFSNLYLVFTVFVLMFMNWCFEAIKWRFLICKIEKISFLVSLKSIFLAIALGIFTPNRVGELGGRVLMLEKQNKIKGVLAGTLGSFSQSLIMVVFGFIALIFVILFYDNNIHFQINNFNIILSIFVLSGTILSLILYFKIAKLPRLFFRFKFLKKYSESFNFFKNYSTKELFIFLIISFLRYFIFITQFYLLLIFFKVDILLVPAYLSISLTYLAITVIPSIVLVDIGVRGSAAIFFIGIFASSTSGILSAAFFIWFINLVLPALFGLILMILNKK